MKLPAFKQSAGAQSPAIADNKEQECKTGSDPILHDPILHAGQSDGLTQLDAVKQRLGEQTQEFPEYYDEARYDHIITAWLQARNIYGAVAKGDRNNMFYNLALDLRYICDFNEDWMLKVMPTWDLPLQERKNAIHSAVSRPRGRELPTPILTAVSKVKSLNGKVEEEALSAEMRNPLPKKLPNVFRLITKRFTKNPHAMLLCSLPPLGTLCTNMRAMYMDGWTEESPLFFCILVAPQASGKRIASLLNDLVMTPLRRHDDEQRELLMEYEKAKRKAKNEKKQPEEPEVDIRIVPLKNSNAIFLKRMYYAKGKSLYSFGEELDTLVKSMKSGAWSDKGDLIRLAFDGGEFGQDYMSENSFSAVCEARWCMLASGTLGAVNRMFRDVEDGMMTRFMFASIDGNRGKALTPTSKNWDREEAAIIAEAERLYEVGSLGEKITISLPKTIKALDAWQRIQIRLWEMTGKTNDALDTLRRRAMAMGFRSALVSFATEGMRETQACADFAVWVAQEVLDQQMALFADKLNAAISEEKSAKSRQDRMLRSNSNLTILAAMPDTFTQNDILEYRELHGLGSDTRTTVHRWLEQGYVTAADVDGKRIYKKVAK